jgi:hypothetical protein
MGVRNTFIGLQPTARCDPAHILENPDAPCCRTEAVPFVRSAPTALKHIVTRALSRAFTLEHLAAPRVGRTALRQTARGRLCSRSLDELRCRDVTSSSRPTAEKRGAVQRTHDRRLRSEGTALSGYGAVALG